MGANSDKPRRWARDTRASVDQFNLWFRRAAPEAFRSVRRGTAAQVRRAFDLTRNLTRITPGALDQAPEILAVLRMCTCPPLARDRLAGLSGTSRTLIGCLEEGKLPVRLPSKALDAELRKIVATIAQLLDADVLPWLVAHSAPMEREVGRSCAIIADRLCTAIADPIVRNAQEQRQLATIRNYLEKRSYTFAKHPSSLSLSQMPAGTFAFRVNVSVSPHGQNGKVVKIPIDAVVQPRTATLPHLPVLIEAKSAGDFANVNKRRKEEATKARQLRDTFGSNLIFALFLCGYFDSGYLEYEADAGIDWVWEHRADDLRALGI